MEINPLLYDDTKISNIRTNVLIVGIFFLIWSLNGYFIGGNSLKMLMLMFGFLLVLGAVFTLPKRGRFVKFSIITFVFFIIYLLIALVQNQSTSDLSVVVFDIICYLLLLSGFAISRNLNYFTKISSKVIFFIVILSLFGSLMFVRFQTQLILNSVAGGSRNEVSNGDDGSINVIGIAYANAILFFILYFFLNYCKVNKWLKMLTFVGIIGIVFVILFTQSRGALIYIILILILNNLQKFNSFTKILKIILISVIFIVGFITVIQLSPILQDKFEGTFMRFQTLLELSQDSEADKSSLERTLMMKDFYENLSTIIIFGKENYDVYPHNQFLEIVMRWGIFFGFPLIVISLSIFFKSIKVVVNRASSIHPFVNFVALMFLFSFLQSLSSMSLDMNRMFWFGLGFLSGIPETFKLTNKNIENELF